MVGWLFIGLVVPVEGVSLNPSDIADWAKVLHPRMVPNVVVLSLQGLICAVLLKNLLLTNT